jgi:hypothetical protein
MGEANAVTRAAIIARASRDKDKWAKSVGEQLAAVL